MLSSQKGLWLGGLLHILLYTIPKNLVHIETRNYMILYDMKILVLERMWQKNHNLRDWLSGLTRTAFKS